MSKKKTDASHVSPAQEGVSSLESHAGFWLRFVSNHVSARFEASVAAEGVSLSEWVALRSLFDTGTSDPAALMRELGMTKGAVSKIITRLEQRGLLSRQISAADKRATQIHLTVAGKNLVPKLAALADENDALYFGHLSGNQRSELIALMKQIVDIHGLKVVPVK
ncbi:MarR family winged helix-turn-helix transcriptional regulator [Undibacterium pigrum]|uniref:DNA-binding MarR family transcriptional regulator n=1 Tax=Undibacterium pigrum TaxID=401470 RepID=A0A318IU23_9BURK|nr:MarR family transcriptional regulator [Undibacterium pigrum]PXX39656.1 DNA-binding MarR family transcriptional regulator [Undibacterium pigrum]